MFKPSVVIVSNEMFLCVNLCKINANKVSSCSHFHLIYSVNAPKCHASLADTTNVPTHVTIPCQMSTCYAPVLLPNKGSVVLKLDIHPNMNCFYFPGKFNPAQAQVAAPGVMGSTVASGSVSNIILACVLSAVVACVATVVIMMAVRQVRQWKTKKAAQKAFINISGRLTHTDHMGFDNRSQITDDTASVSTVDGSIE